MRCYFEAMRDRTLCFLLKSDPPDEVLLGFKKIGFGAGKYTGIGGKVEPDETIVNAALRELEEEIGVKASEHNLIKLGQLTFLFPANPAWSQVVHVFQVTEWKGDPAESDEMKPAWFGMNQLPFEQMWQDAPHWLPNILAGESLRMCFIFKDDNETICEIKKGEFSTSD